MTYAAPISAGHAPGHRAVTAHLVFRRSGSRTGLAGQRTPHPFHITRPFRMEGDPDGMATLYLQSSAGGLYGDDELSLDVTAEPGAAAHVTTQASSVVHHARGGQTRHSVSLLAMRDSLLEYLPDPAILFSGANLKAQIDARLEPGARLLICDAALTHDPYGDAEPFVTYENEIVLRSQDGTPLMIEHSVVRGADWAARTGRLPVHGLLIAAGAMDTRFVTEALRAALPESAGNVYAACSSLADRDLVATRILAADGATLMRTLDTAWMAARQAMTGLAPQRRRK